MDFVSKLKELESSIKKQNIEINPLNFYHLPIYLAYYELDGYSRLINEVHQKKETCEIVDEKEKYIKVFKMIFLSQRKMYKRILRNLNNGEIKVLYPKTTLKKDESYLYDVLESLWKVDKNISIDDNMKSFMIQKLKQKIIETNQELYILKYHPSAYINCCSTFIGPNPVSKYPKDMIIYKDAYISSSKSNSYSVFYNENTTAGSKNTLLNILAFFNGEPSFYFNENSEFNRKLSKLYEQFDLLDMLRLRGKNYFDSNREEPFFLEIPILKQNNGYNLISFKDSQHEMIFELYHASLKQFEPLPRCVFLYRVFEYGAANHYKPLIRPSKYSPEQALIYYFNEVMIHKFNPLYYVDFGTYLDKQRREVFRKRKAKYINFITKLKDEAKKINKEWGSHSYLKDKSIGEIIYVTGRNASAHGGSGRNNARYDYSMNYQHINNVNIILELIARYIIEKLHPNLANMVERRTGFYIKHNQYENIFQQERDKLS